MRWPWKREDVPSAAAEPGGRAAPEVPSPAGWAFLPPLQRTIGEPHLTTSPVAFPQQLPAWRNPSMTGAMAHVVSAEAPSGVIDGDGAGVPRQLSTGPDLDLPQLISSSDAHVQRVRTSEDAVSAGPGATADATGTTGPPGTRPARATAGEAPFVGTTEAPHVSVQLDPVAPPRMAAMTKADPALLPLLQLTPAQVVHPSADPPPDAGGVGPATSQGGGDVGIPRQEAGFAEEDGATYVPVPLSPVQRMTGRRSATSDTPVVQESASSGPATRPTARVGLGAPLRTVPASAVQRAIDTLALPPPGERSAPPVQSPAAADLILPISPEQSPAGVPLSGSSVDQKTTSAEGPSEPSPADITNPPGGLPNPPADPVEPSAASDSYSESPEEPRLPVLQRAVPSNRSELQSSSPQPAPPPPSRAWLPLTLARVADGAASTSTETARGDSHPSQVEAATASRDVPLQLPAGRLPDGSSQDAPPIPAIAAESLGAEEAVQRLSGTLAATPVASSAGAEPSALAIPLARPGQTAVAAERRTHDIAPLSATSSTSVSGQPMTWVQRRTVGDLGALPSDMSHGPAPSTIGGQAPMGRVFAVNPPPRPAAEVAVQRMGIADLGTPLAASTVRGTTSARVGVQRLHAAFTDRPPVESRDNAGLVLDERRSAASAAEAHADADSDARTDGSHVDPHVSSGVNPYVQRLADLTGAAAEQHNETAKPKEASHPTAGASPAAASGGGGDMSAAQLEELARRLFVPLSRRLRADLLLERERRGQRTGRR